MEIQQVRQQFGFNIDRYDAAIAGGLVGMVQSGMLMHLFGTYYIRAYAWLVGSNDITVGWTILFIISAVGGLVFAGTVSNFVQDFSTSVMMLSRKSDILRKILVPLLNFSAMGITLSGIGWGFGLAYGLIVWSFAMPVYLHLFMGGGLAEGMPLPAMGLLPLFAWAHYGGLLGLVYGYVLEN